MKRTGILPIVLFITMLNAIGCASSAPTQTAVATRSSAPVLASALLQQAPPQNEPWFRIGQVRVDPARGVVEFPGVVATDAGDESGLFASIELFICQGEAKSHESLVITDVLPSEIHAALLLAGATPGSPATFDRRSGSLVRTPATGSLVEVAFQWGDSNRAHPTDWLRDNSGQGEEPRELQRSPLVFAGSRSHPSRGYIADAEGLVASLVTFPTVDDFETPTPGVGIGVETLVWPDPISESQDTDPAAWEPNPGTVPPRGTELVVRLSVLDTPGEDSQE